MIETAGEKFGVIYCDPPWYYNNRKTGGERLNKTKFGGGAMKHYGLMKDKDLISMSPFVQELTAENCACFMWATMPRLDFGIQLLTSWGFKYKTVAFCWVKTTSKGFKFGCGYYTASNAEIVLLGIKGKMCPEKRLIQSVIAEPTREHSRKPDAVRGRIEQMFPSEKKIELFARTKATGWEVFGNQTDKFEGEAHAE